MARDKIAEKGKVRFKYVEFELDANDATLQESLRNIATAIMRGNGAPQRPLNGKAAPIAALTSNADHEEHVADEEADEEAAAAPAAPARPKATGVPRSPEIIDVDFVNNETPLKQFLARARVTEATPVQRRYLAIAHWFKNHAGTPEVTMDHAHTAFRHMGWNTPADASQPLRDMKQKQKWMGKGEAKGAYKINHIGENVVNEMLRDGTA